MAELIEAFGKMPPDGMLCVLVCIIAVCSTVGTCVRYIAKAMVGQPIETPNEQEE